MIKVLVVDDDHLVRKGLISVLPWNRYKMEVVGEANNGDAALKFMEENAVDLLITDIAMPVMNGLELIRIVNEQFPHIKTIVLTLHQDFEFIQDALRQGVIDYIAKIELETDKLDEVIQRIYDRYWNEKKQDERENMIQHLSNEQIDEMVVVFAPLGSLTITALEQTITEGTWEELDAYSWLWLPTTNSLLDCQSVCEKITIHYPRLLIGWLMESNDIAYSEMKQTLRRHGLKYFFYQCTAPGEWVKASIVTIKESGQVITEEQLLEHKQWWISLDWMHNDQIYHNRLQQLKEMQLPIAHLNQLMLEIVVHWNKQYSFIFKGDITVPTTFICWQQYVDWLAQLREQSAAVTKTTYSSEVTACIMRALKIVEEELADSLVAGIVAQRVNLSRSYFNQCFKDIVGLSFNEYVQQQRMKQAQNFLLRTNRSIRWISEQCGYTDEKYFSKLFRDIVGITPSEFRRRK
ncbi:response regulator [Paenibacillus yanchengensis]|uniref:Response regulator n=1 Tax=Paenibacillus yanchengensis TaxID=2035833 RepID=A0ABW4YQR7_9BACL